VLDKVRHAAIRGIVVGLAYAVGSWKILDWFIRRFLISGGGGIFGFGRGRVGDAVKESVGGMVTVGIGRFSFNVDLVFCELTGNVGQGSTTTLTTDTHLLILLPQISSILRLFVYKNLRLARSRAYALTVSSRRKPTEFWSQVCTHVDPNGHQGHYVLIYQGYIEEWAKPPAVPPGAVVKGGHRSKEAKWIGWILWWPTQLVLRHCKSSFP